MNKSDNNLQKVILEVAEQLFLDKGFMATSTTEIAKLSGCNQALIHYYFRTKEALFQEIFNAKMSRMVANFFTITNDDISFEEKLRHAIEVHFDIICENPKLPRLALNEVISNPKRLEQLFENNYEKCHSIIKQLEDELKYEIEQGRIRPISIKDLMVNIASMNVMSFLTLPLISSITNMDSQQQQTYLQGRKSEVVTTIIRSLRV